MTDTGTGTEEGRIATIQGLADRVDKLTGLVEKVIGSVQSGGSAQQAAQAHETAKLNAPSDLQSQIDAAVAKVTADRDKADADAAHAAEHEQMKAAAAEKPPMERKRSHKFMGWGEPPQ